MIAAHNLSVSQAVYTQCLHRDPGSSSCCDSLISLKCRCKFELFRKEGGGGVEARCFPLARLPRGTSISARLSSRLDTLATPDAACGTQGARLGRVRRGGGGLRDEPRLRGRLRIGRVDRMAAAAAGERRGSDDCCCHCCQQWQGKLLQEQQVSSEGSDRPRRQVSGAMGANAVSDPRQELALRTQWHTDDRALDPARAAAASTAAAARGLSGSNSRRRSAAVARRRAVVGCNARRRLRRAGAARLCCSLGACTGGGGGGGRAPLPCRLG